jgi:asparagine synthase (glutamine-hydrolysing)
MSAIYGIINKNGKPVEAEMVQKMKQAMQHRAKDGGAEWIGHNAAFGFCHLIVYPNQEHEILPLESGDLVITANAHLHNREELVKKLGVDTKQYATTPDSYLILKAFERWGEDCVQHLDGEYVYAIWNKVSKKLFISNDHVGFVNLFYYESEEQFIFSSEVKGIEAAKETVNHFDDEALLHYFLKSGDPGRTHNKEIKRLINANSLQLKKGVVYLQKYWNLTKQNRYGFKKDEEWYNQLKLLITEAIESRLNPNVPIGISLSGGLDSGSIACLVAPVLKQKNKPLYAFSSVLPASYQGELNDEKYYIDKILKANDNIIYTGVTAEGADPYEKIEEHFELDEIYPNSFHYMDRALLEAATHKNVKILYSGFGGDFWVSWNVKKLFPFLFTVGGTPAEFFKTMSQVAITQNVSLYDLYIKETKKYIAGLKWVSKMRPATPFDSIWKEHFRKKFKLAKKTGTSKLEAINKGYFGQYVSVLLSRSENYGISAANPLIDRKLFEFLADVPNRLYFKKGVSRSLIKNSMHRVLPKEIQERNTKSWYVINHNARLERSPQIIETFIREDEFCEVMSSLVSKEAFRTYINQVPHTNNLFVQHSLDRILLCMLTTKFLYFKKNYVFD